MPRVARALASVSVIMCQASESISRAGQTKPASFSTMSSAAPHFVLVTTGSPQAIASSAALGQGSYRVGNTNASAAP